ncbi:hypothetical protein KQX54_016505 [Cotesia glomerata]|uniref:Uncharacterized protein n=1 Tax=Cotesia glomerata TaxID=32391 RepID=A0AAV7HS06_COTGL|nr:hypothetical protein KQX54_016505 [Cotesia glomerata]
MVTVDHQRSSLNSSEQQGNKTPREFNNIHIRTSLFPDGNNARKRRSEKEEEEEEEEEEEAYMQHAHTYALEPLLIIFRPRRGSRRAVKGEGMSVKEEARGREDEGDEAPEKDR